MSDDRKKMKGKERVELLEGEIELLEDEIKVIKGRFSEIEKKLNDVGSSFDKLNGLLIKLLSVIDKTMESYLPNYVPMSTFNHWVDYVSEKLESQDATTIQGQKQQKINYKPGGGLLKESEEIASARAELQKELKALFRKRKEVY